MIKLLRFMNSAFPHLSYDPTLSGAYFLCA